MLQENDLWNIIIQLTCGLRAIHQANLSCRYFSKSKTFVIHTHYLQFSNFRSLDPSKIIIDGKRIRFSFLGMADIISNDPNQPNPIQLVNHYQQVCTINL